MTTARPRRADAERSIARILAAARARLAADPSATTDDIAKAAGVGRMTLYGHFRTRAELVEAAMVDALRAAEEPLAAVDLEGEAKEVMTRLLESSWELVAESGALLDAAQGVLPAGRLRELHEGPAKRVEELVERGRAEGAFRTDLPTVWLVSVVHYILHGAAAERSAGRLAAREAGRAAVQSVLSVLSAPA
ncbi:TetR/AcrR family transcriptional regulator [Streptomyces boninensis]|uniref:TetR/AcrR family transcriptional regulator n=1 Tax=Streptomyces boninensis TaxID=2039455 RepID=UPI003B216F07